MDSKSPRPEETFQAIMTSLDATEEGKAFLERQTAPAAVGKKKRQPRKRQDATPSMTIERREVIIEFK